MKPLKLTMQEFGSYGKKTVIDFTEPQQNLFLISGETGAGKSTIFDAIVYALYGEASSVNSKRVGADLCSHYVAGNVDPFVELEFQDNSEIYIIKRTPRHRKPHKKTWESEKAVLTMPDDSVYPARETENKIIEIVGLTKSQFMQIAMIAQGEFMTLLRDSSNNKKVVFRKLFDTEFYQKIIDEINNRIIANNSDIKKIQTICQAEAAHLSLPDYYSDRKVLEYADNVIKADKFSVTGLEELMEELAGVCGALENDRKEADEEYSISYRNFISKNDEHSRAESLMGNFKDREKAEKTLEECSKAEADIKEKRSLLKRIPDAYEIQYTHSAKSSAFADLNDSIEKYKKITEELPQLKERFKCILQNERLFYEKYQETVIETGKVVERVKKDKAVFYELDKSYQDLNNAEKGIQAAVIEENRIADTLKKLAEKAGEWKIAQESLVDSEIQLNLVIEEEKQGKRLKTMVSELKEAYKALDKLKKDSSEAAGIYVKMSDQYEKCNAEYDEMNRIYLDSQAGFLAMKLKDGEPCPVCGSTEHPHPHNSSNRDKEISRKGLDEKFEVLNSLRQKMIDAAETAGKKKSVFEERKAGIEISHKRLLADMEEKGMHNSNEHATVFDTEAIIDKWSENIKKLLEEKKVNIDKLNKLKAAIKKADEDKILLEKELKAAEERKNRFTVAFSAAEASINTLSESKIYNTIESALEAENKAEEELNSVKNLYASVKVEYENAKSEKEKAETLIKKYELDIPELEKKYESASRIYTDTLMDKNMSESDWKTITESFSRDTALIEAEVSAFDRKKAAAEELLKSAREKIAGAKMPDVAKLAEEKENAEALMKAAQLRAREIEACLTDNTNAEKILKAQMEERKEVMDNNTRLYSVYNLLAGKQSGARMDIETYVQRYYLDRILDAANARFYQMSSGQFELRMCKLEEAGEGGNKGLDLMVYSTVTGKEREIKTLSGGESFMAALALALGMGDTIQNNSAAINLDIMFIDEGFGSLSENSRNQAIKVLKKMADGSKLIGIISHVTELKQEIEDQLQVTKDEEGSHVKWELA